MVVLCGQVEQTQGDLARRCASDSRQGIELPEMISCKTRIIACIGVVRSKAP